MNFICWNEELKAKNIFAVKDAFKDATGCSRKQLNSATGWQELFSTPQNVQIHIVLVAVLK